MLDEIKIIVTWFLKQCFQKRNDVFVTSQILESS